MAKIITPEFRKAAARKTGTKTHTQKIRVSTLAQNESVLSNDKIFQIFFEPDQKSHLDPAFEPFDNSGDESGLYEYSAFKRLFKRKEVAALSRWGAMSWRFGQKTGLSGDALLSLIAQRPDVDLFYTNPEPFYEGLFQNFWLQGETRHPGLLKIVIPLLEINGVDKAEVFRVNQSREFSSANYFIGTKKFWKQYIAFIDRILLVADQKLPADLKTLMWSDRADPRRLHRGSSYVPFIIERLFPVFLRTAGRDLTVLKLPLPAREQPLNEHIKRLRELKDAAVQEKSDWLLRAWMNYRNLYLQSVSPKAWCDRYFPLLNPKDITW